MTAGIGVLGPDAAEMNRQVDVNGTSRVPARIDSGELDDALVIRDLGAGHEARAIHMSRTPSAGRGWRHTWTERFHPVRWWRHTPTSPFSRAATSAAFVSAVYREP